MVHHNKGTNNRTEQHRTVLGLYRPAKSQPNVLTFKAEEPSEKSSTFALNSNMEQRPHGP